MSDLNFLPPVKTRSALPGSASVGDAVFVEDESQMFVCTELQCQAENPPHRVSLILMGEPLVSPVWSLLASNEEVKPGGGVEAKA